MISLDDKSFTFEFIHNGNRYFANCHAQFIKINRKCLFSGTYQVKLHDFKLLDAVYLYSYNELTTQWEGLLIESNNFVQPGIMEIIAEEIANRKA